MNVHLIQNMLYSSFGFGDEGYAYEQEQQSQVLICTQCSLCDGLGGMTHPQD